MNKGIEGEKVSYNESKLIHQLFEEQVNKTPDEIAVICKEEYLTYKELNKKANQLARKLRTLGVKPDVIVALMVKRNVNMMIGMLAILKAGGCYMPIDASYPLARINYMLEDSKSDIVVTESNMGTDLEYKGVKVYIEDSQICKLDNSNLENINVSQNLIYIIYTSGSTGKPKGVMIEHRSVHNFINGMTKNINFLSRKTIVSLTTISFDIFVLESLLPLTLGMKIIIADPMNFSKYLCSYKIDMLQTTPSTMSIILNNKSNISYLKNMTEIMLGGEPCPTRLLHDLKACSSAKIYNMYGPTETTIWSTIKELTTSDNITIGRPIDNTQIYIVDKNNQLLPMGQAGELCIAGDGLARGYFGMRELTNEKFIINPSTPYQRMYKTGDIAKILQDGDIEYLGRNDSVVKIRGFRIGTVEIEDCLKMNRKIEECAVIPLKNKWDETYLLCYYVSKENITITDIIIFLKAELPEYMIPGVYIKMDELPLTPNGKINRKLLPEPNQHRPNLDTFYVGPDNDIENEISTIWKKILNLNLVGINDNFFQLGGNSILLCQLHVELDKIYPRKIEIVDIFANPTIRELCKFIQENGTRKTQDSKLPILQLKDEFYNEMYDNRGEVVLIGTIDQQIVEKLRKYSEGKESTLSHMLLGIYLYILSENSFNRNIEISLIFDNKQYNSKISIDFSKLSDLDEINRAIYKQVKDGVFYDITTAEVLNNTEKNRSNIIPLFYFNSQRLEHKNELFCLDLSVRTNQSGCEFTLLFNESILNKGNIEKLFLKYLSLLKSITNKL